MHDEAEPNELYRNGEYWVCDITWQSLTNPRPKVHTFAVRTAGPAGVETMAGVMHVSASDGLELAMRECDRMAGYAVWDDEEV